MILEAPETSRDDMPGACDAPRGSELLAALKGLRADVDAGGRALLANWESRILQPGFRERALNLVHYILIAGK